jgi:hypothetical protein
MACSSHRLSSPVLSGVEVRSGGEGAAVREGPTCHGEALPQQGEDGPSVTLQAPTYPAMQQIVGERCRIALAASRGYIVCRCFSRLRR